MSELLIIDGREYDVAVVELQRSADILDKTANRTEDGVLHREVIGTYYNYTMKIFTWDMDLYEELFWVLSAPQASHVVELPNDHVRYEAYFSSIKDSVVRVYPEKNAKYKGLSCKLTAIRPRRRA